MIREVKRQRSRTSPKVHADRVELFSLVKAWLALGAKRYPNSDTIHDAYTAWLGIHALDAGESAAFWAKVATGLRTLANLDRDNGFSVSGRASKWAALTLLADDAMDASLEMGNRTIYGRGI